MGRIRVLPDHLANQIAAGEVVERPASALKELVENSLDAGADKIRVVLEAGGKRRLRVEDNGCGMDRDDCLMALERHATSKLTRAEDLFSIRSLGFRGEALPSIASVSRMTLESRRAEDESGVRVELNGSKLFKVTEISRPPGTTITVDQLFFNIPARRKFLRKTETELSWMVNLITQYSMAHIDKHFILEHNDRTIMDVTPVKSLKERIYQHFGKSMIDELVPFESQRDWLKVWGLTALPTLLKNSRNFQFLFVNGRLVKDKVLAHAIGEAYTGFGEGKIYPVIFLFLEVPSEEVDVNVHPAKTEVKFINANAVHDGVRDIVREALVAERADIPYRFREGYHEHPSEPSPTRVDPWSRPAQQQSPLPGSDPASQSPLFQGGQRPPVAPQGGPTPYDRFVRSHGEIQAREPAPGAPAATATAPAPGGDSQRPPGQAPPMAVRGQPAAENEHLFDEQQRKEMRMPRIIGQFRDSYILAEQDGDLLLIDQHVVHERILYDQISASLAAGAVERQALLVPQTIELTPAQIVDLEQVLPALRQFGFDLDPFDGNTYVIREVPIFLEGERLDTLVAELIEKARGERRETAIEAMIDHYAATKACKAAVKVNMRLTPEKMEHMLARLYESATPMFCPHGRPIVLRFSNEEIEKNFHRK
ncbi:DNA mismatch repair endonuclease MutL [Sulfidibacter corallicola]|uniref:DNA mismatch repair protein MutL n=1 Tax=Sulfidibacter corallicola TaxID=2818388 RepID=A0A8A4TUZ2_SULCO|nr:DNA mismatch repair endonuclease MutL [Sulfidibacter corallicola]QTD53303.1 DNA mismatch repair endonuclease MutL [Sulfidibacter corallicola]